MRRYIMSYLAVTLLAAGCATTATETASAPADDPAMASEPAPEATNYEPTPMAAAETVIPHPHNLNVVAYTKPGLDNKIEAAVADMHRTSNNTTAVHCTLKNLTNCKMKVQVRTTFYDDNRHPLGPATAWKPVFIAPNSIESYTAHSYTNEPANYYIEVMPL